MVPWRALLLLVLPRGPRRRLPRGLVRLVRVRLALLLPGHGVHVVRLGRGLVQRLVRLLRAEERDALALRLAPARADAAARDGGEEEHARGDGEADDELEVRADALAERGARGRPRGVAAHGEEVGVRLGRVRRQREELDVRVRGAVRRAVDEVAEVDVGVGVADCIGGGEGLGVRVRETGKRK